MKPPILAAAAIALITLAVLPAQAPPRELEPASGPDPEAVAEAIRKFNESKGIPTEATKEVVVDLTTKTPAAKNPSPAPDPAAKKPDESPPKATPVPADATAPADPPASATPPESADPAPPASPEPKESLTVKVEQLQTATGTVDPSTVKLLAPFPAKPLGALPAGWKLDPSADAPAFARQVEIAPKTSITLNIKPHVLVPVADGSTTFSVAEPGFDPAYGYQQVQTVGAVLARSIDQLDEDAKQLGAAIDQLQQLVTSLPKPNPKPAPKPDAKPAANPKPSNKR